MESNITTNKGKISPVPIPPYQLAMRNFLKTEEAASWAWFTEIDKKKKISDSVRVDLLKTTYRLDRMEFAELYSSAQDILEKFALDIPLTIYQAQGNHDTSAALYYLPGEAHIVFFGKTLDLLNQAELKAVMAHELAHYLLWQEQDNEVFIADQLLNTMANDPRAENAHILSARRFQLFTEIYADRGALYIMQNKEIVVQALVKIMTGLSSVSGATYLAQAEEIFAKGSVISEGISHPEAFIRARSLALCEANEVHYEEKIESMICGEMNLNELDLINQNQLATETQCLLLQITKPTWISQNDLFRNRLSLYANDEIQTIAPPATSLSDYTHKSIQGYFIYLMLDFIALDSDFQDAVALHCYDLALQYSWESLFLEKYLKECKVTKTHWNKTLKDKTKILLEANLSEAVNS